ncbi:hypothetical protein KW785_03260 [Candidatus Parcubacteria bacterium]|nr:hypothetical protein [Candidatus Parcubacteria bacterium]
MTDEYYKRDLFGIEVNVGLGEEEVEETADKKAWNAGFNIFSLTDAIGARDKRGAWVLYQKALASGLVAEEIFWRVTWIAKSMLLASKTESYKETEMKEFPYKKAKGYAKNFSREELEDLSESLVVGYHNTRRGLGEIETLLEKSILSL